MRLTQTRGLVPIRRGTDRVRLHTKTYAAMGKQNAVIAICKPQRVENGSMTSGDKANMEPVIRLLNEALATEIICILRYKRHYYMIAGISARRTKAKFLQHVTEERAHADQLAERIVQLGGEPVLSLERLLNWSHAEHVEGDSLAEMITADLLAERISIDSYRAMLAAIGGDDPRTRQVLERILAQEEAHAESLSSLLRDRASQREVTPVFGTSCARHWA